MIMTLASQTAQAELTHEGGGVVRYSVEVYSKDDLCHSTAYEGVSYKPESLLEILSLHFTPDEMMDIYSILRSDDQEAV